MAPVELPSHVVFKGNNGIFINLQYRGSEDYLQSNSSKQDLNSVQEVIRVPGQENVVTIKNMRNKKFWRSSGTWVCADKSEKPSTDNLDCFFTVVEISPKKVALQSLANKLYLIRHTNGYLRAAAPDCINDVQTQMEFIEIDMDIFKPVKLPRYVMFKGDNERHLCLHNMEGHAYLCFNTNAPNMFGAHEVIPVPDWENVVMIKSKYNEKFWRWGTNWIWADRSEKPSTNDHDCLFKVVKINSQKVGLQSVANKNYLRRLITEGKVDCLNASAGDCFKDVAAQMEVSEAVKKRRVFDVDYHKDQISTTDEENIGLFSIEAGTTTKYKSDIQQEVSFEYETQSCWSDSTTFSTGLSVTIEAEIPTIAKLAATVSMEHSRTTQMGDMVGRKTVFKGTYTVKDVEPGDMVTISASGTRATGTVPYTYRFQDTLLDDTVTHTETGFDGIFKGVQVVHIKILAIDSRGNEKEVIQEETKLI